MKSRRKPGVDRSKRSPLGKRIVEGLEEAVAHVRGHVRLPVRHIYVPGPIDVRAVRRRTGLSQSEFAARYGFNVRTLQQWEQGRTQPDSAVRAYLVVIHRNRQGVEQALRRTA